TVIFEYQGFEETIPYLDAIFLNQVESLNASRNNLLETLVVASMYSKWNINVLAVGVTPKTLVCMQIATYCTLWF
ncbi:hypothetical protein, partial [Leptospira bandrabouensis]|uniref:hypothetical protein n=1 Tax=Leptospira bandrabouensis TaxID=2484903 RepID=UPI001EEAF08B